MFWSLATVPFTFNNIQLLPKDPFLFARRGLNILKNPFGLEFNSSDFMLRNFLMAVCHCFEAAFLVFLFISHSPQYCCLHMFLLPSLVPDCFLPVLGHERDIFRWRTLFFLLDVFISNVVDKTIITVFFKRFKYVHNIPWCSN